MATASGPGLGEAGVLISTIWDFQEESLAL